MKMDIVQFKHFALITQALQKRAQSADENERGRRDEPTRTARGTADKPKPKRKSDPLRGAYPDYGKSLVSQRQQDPHVTGLIRGAKTGVTGSILAAVLARLLTDNKAAVGGAALLGGVAGGVPGYMSGVREAESTHTKNLALRRLGINNPAELMIMRQNPELTKRITSQEVYL